jgi:glycosyltransferase involved in cell wall biosynthesis
MRVLALEPYYGGSHRAFIDAWIRGSRHQWTLLTLPAYTWKWRMRHGAMTLAGAVGERLAAGENWDVLWCSDMLDLAAFRGLAPVGVHALPAVAYFHENQLTYPVRVEEERDLHFGLTNLSTALAAGEVWFNSAFHRREFLDAVTALLERMPDFQPLDAVDRVRAQSRVHPQGIEPMPARGARRPGPLRIVWTARWEFDKDPDTFFEALEVARAAGVELRLSVLGERFKRVPEVFARARESFAGAIDRWGYLPRRADYLAALAEADVVVSTARHEFFGVGVIEAIAAGCFPVLPRRLAYPEVLAGLEDAEACFYDGTARALAAKLGELAERRGDLWGGDPERGRRAVSDFAWPNLRPRLDDALESAAGGILAGGPRKGARR